MGDTLRRTIPKVIASNFKIYFAKGSVVYTYGHLFIVLFYRRVSSS